MGVIRKMFNVTNFTVFFLDVVPNNVSGHYFRRFFPFFLIQKVILQKLVGMPNNLGLDPFLDPIGHFEAPCGHFGFCRRCGVAGGEGVPPVPLGWYSLNTHFVHSCIS